MGDKQLLTNKSLSKLSSSKPSSSRLKDDQKDSLMVEIPDVETTIRKSADKFKKMGTDPEDLLRRFLMAMLG